MPDGLASVSPNLAAVVKQEKVADDTKVVTIKSVMSSISFTHFAKDVTWAKDLYEDFVEPTLKQPFYWETWRRNPYTEPNRCVSHGDAYDSINVLAIGMGDGTTWSYTNDHCKWGISVTGSWVCVGDINRMTSQKNRGGFVCCDISLYMMVS